MNEVEVSGWTPQQVADYLATGHLAQYRAKIIEQEITGDLLLDLEDSDWQEVGIDNGLNRKRLIAKVNQLRERPGSDAEARIQALSDRVNELTTNLKLTNASSGVRPDVNLCSSVCTEGAWFDGAPEVQYELLACPDYVEMAESLVLQQPNRFRYQ